MTYVPLSKSMDEITEALTKLLNSTNVNRYDSNVEFLRNRLAFLEGLSAAFRTHEEMTQLFLSKART